MRLLEETTFSDPRKVETLPSEKLQRYRRRAAQSHCGAHAGMQFRRLPEKIGIGHQTAGQKPKSKAIKAKALLQQRLQEGLKTRLDCELTGRLHRGGYPSTESIAA
jgi:hypothetical protein